MKKRAPSGVLVVDKPRGPTSHDVVQRVRRALATREVGHAGTLDPMATGVLVVAVGEATKLVPWLTAADKGYTATLVLGVATDSYDAEGTVVETRTPDPSWRTRLPHALEVERTRREQIPPAFSAIKTDGVRAHERARRGESVELAARPVEVRTLDASASLDADELTIEVAVAKGYYVRSLARDLAAALGTVGHLTALRRTRSGAFTMEEAAPLDAPDLALRLVPLAHAAARALPVARLSGRGTDDARAGRRVAPSDLVREGQALGPHAWLAPDGALVAVGEIEADGSGRVLRGFTSSASSP